MYVLNYFLLIINSFMNNVFGFFSSKSMFCNKYNNFKDN